MIGPAAPLDLEREKDWADIIQPIPRRDAGLAYPSRTVSKRCRRTKASRLVGIGDHNVLPTIQEKQPGANCRHELDQTI